MLKIRIGLVVVLLLIMVYPVFADDPVPDHIQAMVSRTVLVANGTDFSVIEVTVFNQSDRVPNLSVDFMVNDSSLGNVSPVSTFTSVAGVAETTFTVKKESGIAELSARVFYTINGTQYQHEFPISPIITILDPIPDTIYFNSSKEWLVANGTDHCSAILQAYNRSYPIPNLNVQFSVLEPNMGSFNTINRSTDENGKAISEFMVAHKSGNATFKAFIKYIKGNVETVEERQYIQKIDHDTPFNLTSYNAPSEISVGSAAPIIMGYSDQWGNPVDNRRFAETVLFLVSSPLDDALFLNASSPFTTITIPVDGSGKAIAWLQAGTSVGINVVRVDPEMGSMPDKYFFIQGIANKSPVRITQEVSPQGYNNNPPKQYADGVSLYSFTYIITDKFGNGVMSSPIQINTTIPGEDRIIYTNSIGQAMITYGPKTSIGKITITATSLANTSVTCSKEIWFISQKAEDMQFSIVPDSIPSRDVEGWVPAELMAKVIDENGNPVEGELVTFTMGTPYYQETYTITDPPEIVNPTALSNEDGYAIGYFNPGGFTPNWLDLHYDESATGTCEVTASWVNQTSGKSSNHSLNVTWKNYPYLSITTQAFPQTVNVTGIVDILVRLKGDGWALQPKPIDTVLCTDRSGSMLQDDPIDRFIPVMNASRDFTGAMHVSLARDHIGLISFGTLGWANLSPTYSYLNGNYYCYSSNGGWRTRTLKGWYYDWTGVYGVNPQSTNTDPPGFTWVYNDNSWDMTDLDHANYWPYTINYDTNGNHQIYLNTHYPGNNKYYDDYAITEQLLSPDSSLINSSINMMVPVGGTPMRYAIYKSINEIKARGRQSAVKAIIILSDGDYNWYGDPLARGTGSTTNDPTSYGDLTTNYIKFSDLNTTNQNMSKFAINNNIHLYSIGYAEDISTGGRNTLRTLAESTGGKYYDGNAANIGDIYRSIAGDLQTEAGVNTQMNLTYDTIEVNYQPVIVNDTYRVFDYVPNTTIDSYLANMTRPPHNPSYSYSIDQTSEWNTTKKLSFPVGTIVLGQTWEATYKLRVLTDGSINVFGPGSKVIFNNGTAQLNVPKTFITGVPEMVTTGINSSILNITIGTPTDTDDGFVQWPIYRNYTGVMQVTEDYYISNDGGMTWIFMGFKKLNPQEANQNGIFSIRRILLPPGEVIFRVVGNALDSPPATPIGLPPPPTTAISRNYIILK